jgi:uncharacterized RDD family membrane protein YckC
VQPAEQLRIDTPEQIALELQVAGIGSRFLALSVDTVLQVALYGLGALAIGFLQVPPYFRQSFLGTAGPALAVLFFFSVYWGYFALFEIIWSGRTPGKRAAGIRVIKDSGRPINAFEAIARNVLRAVDFLPAMYAVGIATMMLNRNSRRLGDFVAGTIVVHDRQTEDVRPPWGAPGAATVSSPELTSQLVRMPAEELQLIETYLHRRLDLDDTVRHEMARRIVTRIANKTGLRPESDQDVDGFLEAVARRIRDTARLR